MRKILVIILWLCFLFLLLRGRPGTVQTAGPLALPFMIIGTAISAYGAYAQGKAAQQEAENAAVISEYNAQVSEREAAAIDQAATRRDEILQQQAREFQATQRATIGRSGVTMSGAPLTVLATTKRNLDLDRLMELEDLDLRARRKRNEATGLNLQADSQRSVASSAGRAAPLSALGTAFSGFGKAAAYKASLS